MKRILLSTQFRPVQGDIKSPMLYPASLILSFTASITVLIAAAFKYRLRPTKAIMAHALIAALLLLFSMSQVILTGPISTLALLNLFSVLFLVYLFFLIQASNTGPPPTANLQAIMTQAEKIAQMGAFEWIPGSNEVTWTSGLYDIYGVSEATFQPGLNSFLDFLHPDYVANVQHTLEKSMKEKSPFVMREKILRPDQSERMLISRAAWVKTPSGDLKLSGVCHDITEQVSADEKIRRLNAILDSANEMFAVIDARTQGLVEVNKKLCQELGYKRSEILKMKPIDIESEYPMATDTLWQGNLESLKRAGKPQTRITNLLRRDQSTLMVEASMTLSYFSEEDYVLAIYRDITEQRRAENEIIKLTSKLLRAQEEERQRVSKDLHDAPLQSISAAKLSLELYLQHPEKFQNRFEMGLQLLDQAGREIREICIDLYPSMLEDLGLEATIRWYSKNYLKIAGIEPELSFDITEPISAGHSITIYRIIQELFSNIKKHAKATRVSLNLFTDINGYITLTVKDNGKGFETSQAHEYGFGMLNINQRVKELNGTLQVNSSGRGGTEIIIRFKAERHEKKENNFPG